MITLTCYIKISDNEKVLAEDYFYVTSHTSRRMPKNFSLRKGLSKETGHQAEKLTQKLLDNIPEQENE